MKIYVGNLSYQLSEDDLRDAFSNYGEVASVTIVKDKFSGESKGFAFVDMPVQTQAEEAIKRLDGSSLKGRNMRVNPARPKTESRPKKFGRF